jgi:TAT (twin-arginine translocation) pathway signal sequence
MSEEILKRLQSRRSFLKGSALLAASALVVPATLSAQDAPPQSNDKDRQGQERRDGQDGQDGQDKRGAQDGPNKSKDAPQQEAKEGDGAQTFIGADGPIASSASCDVGQPLIVRVPTRTR